MMAFYAVAFLWVCYGYPVVRRANPVLMCSRREAE